MKMFCLKTLLLVVLILLLLEYGFGVTMEEYRDSEEVVLILLLLEYGFGEHGPWSSVHNRFNPS